MKYGQTQRAVCMDGLLPSTPWCQHTIVMKQGAILNSAQKAGTLLSLCCAARKLQYYQLAIHNPKGQGGRLVGQQTNSVGILLHN